MRLLYKIGTTAVAALLLLEHQTPTVEAAGCKGGVKGVTYENENEQCNCASVACTQVTCEEDMGGIWTDDCPSCDPAECDPLAASTDETLFAQRDPACTGPPEAIDRFGKKMYKRTLVSREKPQDDDDGTFCHVVFELCEGESQITQGMDSGFGDYYRLAATPKWADYNGTAEYGYGGMHKPDGARSYSPVTPLNENTVQLTIRRETGSPDEYDCTAGVDCLFGMSELACMAPIGTEFLLSKRTDQAGSSDSTHHAYIPNFFREPGSGPYTINVIGQGVALTETHILVLNAMLDPVNSDGSFSTIKEVNLLWANSYWKLAEWTMEKTDSTDLSREMIRGIAKYGIRFNLMHSISREERPEAEFPRIDVNVIGDAFGLTNTTDQDPNVKWFVVGSGGFKNSIYPQILEWGFDMILCNEGSKKKGYPYCGTNSVYNITDTGSDPNDRERSALFKYYEMQTAAPTPAPTGIAEPASKASKKSKKSKKKKSE